jgi:hypothetical protein
MVISSNFQQLRKLLLGRAALLPSAGNSLAGATSRSGVGPRSLSSNWQTSLMSLTTIAANLDQALDIKADRLSQLTFNLIFMVNNFSEAIDFLFRECIYFGYRIYVSLSENLLAQTGANTIYILQRNPRLFVSGYIYTRYTWHSVSSLANMI